MDSAVALVEAYLRVNGYFTVTEYPVVEADRHGDIHTATDLDILAFRFPGAGRLIPRHRSGLGAHAEAEAFAPDPALGISGEQADMLVGEVKEGRAELNQAATDPNVLRVALTRFGCCHAEHVPEVVRVLLRDGQARTHCSHLVRLVAFGSVTDAHASHKYAVISLGHVEQFLKTYVREHWPVLCHMQLKDPAFGFLMLLEKAEKGQHMERS